MAVEETPTWLASLRDFVSRRPLGFMRIPSDEWVSLDESKRGIRDFTLLRPHAALDGLTTGMGCLLLTDAYGGEARLAVIRSKGPVATLGSRIRLVRALSVVPPSLGDLAPLIRDKRQASQLSSIASSGRGAGRLTEKLSIAIVEALASEPANHSSLRLWADALASTNRLHDNDELQFDAVRMALRVFGFTTDEPATQLDLAGDVRTALTRVTISEDAVVEHDAREMPGFELIGSDITGRALFRRGPEQLEVYTANKRPLEELFGVDLIYANLTQENVVMLQYKMLERSGEDWIYRPDDQMAKEIARMRSFTRPKIRGTRDYRLNPGVFYFKFVKRGGEATKSSVIMPLDHFETLLGNPGSQGPRGGVRLSYGALKGQYLRQEGFLELVRAGYVGSHASTTTHLRTLIDSTLKSGHGLVAAIERSAPPVRSVGARER